MNAQQLHDYIIKPTLKYMGGNYNSVEARFLLLCTASIESDCGHFIKQVNGPALGIWQMEPATNNDIWVNCDALKDNSAMAHAVSSLVMLPFEEIEHLIYSPMYACAMARLKYSMTPKELPAYNGGTDLDLDMFYRYYKTYYHGVDHNGNELGKSSFSKWLSAIERNGVLKVQL
jgi:hypothetical protein